MATFKELQDVHAKSVKGLEDLKKVSETERRPLNADEKKKWKAFELQASEAKQGLAALKKQSKKEQSQMDETIKKLK